MSEIDLVSSTEVIVNVWQQGEWQCLLQQGGLNKGVAQVTEICLQLELIDLT
jgi:hypothetical protein